ncbi:MAG: hypothetical protein L0H79_13325 [Intrasporangium sp.]|uniref:hypothetical protein n=1 Tax=Intrasporangium sp. TaxID=1925024 RepID=UPI002647F489|nr:hypothetical protein [Intrasporangium sp.]MDN5796720.1 hypothetical protein [Intrasporangium sp.]
MNTRTFPALAAAAAMLALTGCAAPPAQAEPSTSCTIYVSSYEGATTAEALDSLVAATRLAEPDAEVVVLPHSQRSAADLLAADGGGSGGAHVSNVLDSVPVLFISPGNILGTSTYLVGRTPTCSEGA